MKLRDYQQEAVEFLQSRPRSGLFLDMGLGKTAITLSALTPEHLPVLVTAPPRVVQSVWPQETKTWRPDLRVVVATGKDRLSALKGTIPADVVVIPRDQLTHAVPHAERFQTFVMDELSGFKNRSSVRWRHARAITKHTPHVWGLTGTPAPNGLLDLWAQMFLIDRGESLGSTLGSYRSRYFTEGHRLPSGVVTEWRIRPGAADRIHERLEPAVLSMGTHGRVALPPVTFNDIELDLPASVRTAYDRLKKDMLTELANGAVVTVGDGAGLSSSLRQMAAGFVYPEDRDPRDDGATFTELHSEKLKATREIVESAQGSPVMVAYSFRADLYRLLKEFPEARVPTTAKDIEDWNAGRVPVMLMHPQSAGHGLNLQHGGHTLVWYSPTWSLEEYQQTNKRLARSGQKHPVVIHHLLMRRTVDHAIKTVISGKDTVQSALLHHLDPEGIL